MNHYSIRFVAEFAELLTTALIHFVWQGAVLTLMLLIIVKMLDARTARLRYLLSVCTLLTMGIAPILTILLHHYGNSPSGHSPAGVSDHSGAVAEKPLTTVMTVQPAAGLKEVSATRWNPGIEVYVLIVWLAGVLILSTRLAIGFGVTLWIRTNLQPLSEQFEQRVGLLGKRLRINTRQRVFASMRVGQAVAVGFIRPVVLIPVAWLTQLTTETLEAVIAHELAHIRRWDLWVNLVQRVIETLLFFHPAVWWLTHRIRLEREMCCDEIAAGCLDRSVYARSLESVARIASGNLLMAGSINGGNKMNLLRRIRYLLGVAPAETAGNWWAVGFAGVILPFAAAVAFSLAAGTTPTVAIADDDNDESKAVAKIELLGGKVWREATPPGRPVIGITFQGSTRLTDRYMHHLRPFPNLTTLNLSGTKISNAGWKEIDELKHLSSLNLMGTHITDDGLKDIDTLRNLTSLSLSHSNITDDGLKEIGKLKSLTSLDLNSTKITDTGLIELGELTHLTTAIASKFSGSLRRGFSESSALTEYLRVRLHSRRFFHVSEPGWRIYNV